MVSSTRLVALLAFLFGFVQSPFAQNGQSNDARELFAKAYQLYANGKPARAKELLQKTVETSYRLADYSLYYLARIAVDEKNAAQAREYLTQLRQRFPHSIWHHPATLLRAKSDIAEKNFAAATETLRQLRANKSVSRDIIDEAHFLQGQIHEAQGDFDRAFARYRELRNSSPGSRWATAARKEQTRLRGQFAERFALNTVEAQADEADRLARERQTHDAQEFYKKILDRVSDPNERLSYLVKLAALHLSSGGRNEALPTLEQIARDYPDHAEAPKALYQIGQIYWNRHDNARAFDYFHSLLEKYPASGFVDRAQYASADIHEYFGRNDDAVKLYRNVLKQFPHSQVRDDATWRLAWLYYRSGELPMAQETFRALMAQSRNGPFFTASIYWQARIAEKLNDGESAKQLLLRIVNGGEESYYQALSLRGLERLGTPMAESKIARPQSNKEPDPSLDAEASFHLSRARELGELSLHNLALAELDAISRRANAKNRWQPLLMREYFLNQAYGRSLSLASQLPVIQGERNYYRYPLAYWDSVRGKTQERGVDPYLVLALIRQESLFNTRARSPAAAFGLMQLILPTASRVAQQIGLPAPSPEKLFDPELNLTLGTQYLKDLLDRYGNNWFKAIAAYNAGETAVDRWEKEIVTDDIEEFVERIPYVETRGYVKLVLRNHRIYKRLYEPTQ
ncbi:MAG: tetratricopeptide repeat protein [Deltaproteobacteria bacterium]|nr:tetratricopeptide repeat protein [Deltaproteobacteria bacterium]